MVLIGTDHHSLRDRRIDLTVGTPFDDEIGTGAALYVALHRGGLRKRDGPDVLRLN